MIISSSLPLANHRPECAQRTVNTGPVCIVRVHSDFGGRPDSSEAWLRMGFVLHIRIFASSPPVATREDIDKSGLQVIKYSDLERYEQEGKVASNCVERVRIPSASLSYHCS